ncbi:ABC transporter substrate-binding protein [Hydrogenophaga sp.]|jgi:ABC-type branched-subunit amino acid transport system substrate-binding protein|uniref:ABC transporter substrate-binding protein n=1 Tax=Hydrogenophaga sp. TaxID=1904254 RepID=UPI00271FC0CB|nr:ABC transporter substrate-binding protein [Hydrogenophaga sp.]MDO9250794.1 ABC transporter substrate-binding protein [Hydrogenophaga sp.]MDP2408037.1 ABC transporter substrate-binding protein [Hydrogenophaga sp.]MDP3323336.1 ABC transporter substrate-binding protein [Hydrogenophaga sp.]MDP3887444.1 ABC transporter substrate-binding protein [Hydrogenophaga sp.]MDZ4174837.1 ABC transporter substrate-binding protein [Hydrogenophaga sp.]
MQRRQALSTVCKLVGSSALAAWGAAAQAQSEGVSDNRIVLGQSAPFSGAAMQLGLQFNLGAQLHFDALNALGGVNGRRIEIARLDDGYEPERCAANTRQFIQDGVFALFGYIGTPTSLVALPLATEARTPFFAPFTGAQALREPFNRYAIHVRASYFDETAAIVRQTTSVGIKKMAVFYQNDAYGKAGLEGVTRALKALDLEPVAVGTVERNATDVSQALKDILVAKPEAIVQISAYKSCASFIRLARRQGFSGNFYNVSFVGTQALLEELGAEARGVVVSQVMPFPYSATQAISGEYLAALKDKRGVAPNYSGIEGFVAAKVFAEGVRRAGRNLTREGFIAAVQSMQNLQLGGFTVDFGPKKHTGSRFVELTMLTEDGRVRR